MSFISRTSSWPFEDAAPWLCHSLVHVAVQQLMLLWGEDSTAGMAQLLLPALHGEEMEHAEFQHQQLPQKNRDGKEEVRLNSPLC